MAYDNIVTPAQNFGSAKAGADLSGLQYHLVQIAGSSIKLFTDIGSGAVFCLYNTPSSGEPVTAYGAPNVVKVKAAGTITAGAWVSATSGQVQASDVASVTLNVGIAMTAGVANDIISVKLI